MSILPFSLDKNILLENMNKPIDFYTGDELDMDDISVDHVIPWSFMYSDDIYGILYSLLRAIILLNQIIFLVKKSLNN